MKQIFLQKILPPILYAIFLAWCKSLRIKVNSESKENLKSLKGNYILTLWHSRIFGLLYYLRFHAKLNVLISPSSDGDFLANLGSLLGYIIIRGSSFKKTIPATRSIFKALRKEQGVVIVGDGSRGPRHKFQSGALLIASKTESYLVPMTFDAKWKTELRSWDRFLIPWPFSKCVVSFGEPVYFRDDKTSEKLQKAQMDLELRLNSMTENCFEASKS